MIYSGPLSISVKRSQEGPATAPRGPPRSRAPVPCLRNPAAGFKVRPEQQTLLGLSLPRFSPVVLRSPFRNRARGTRHPRSETATAAPRSREPVPPPPPPRPPRVAFLIVHSAARGKFAKVEAGGLWRRPFFAEDPSRAGDSSAMCAAAVFDAFLAV